MARKKIKHHYRIFIYKRDNFSCIKCGIIAKNIPEQYNGKNTLLCDDGRWLELDHIIPLSKKGLDNINNLQTLCNICNCKKGVKNG